jgi:glycosyltransferase involved in cell wall biosynthesis
MSSKIHAVLTVHDLTWMAYPETMPLSRRLAQRALLPRSLRRANEIVCGSHFTAAEVRENFSDIVDRLSVIHHASSIATGEPANQASNNSDYFLFVGTMEPRKNLARLLQAYKRYTSQCSKPKKLHVVGGRGWGGVDPLQLVKNNDLIDDVTILGQLDDTALATQYAGAYALLMPSLYEGFGLPVVEAMSFGIPSLVSATSAMSEVAANSGITADPLSVESIASALGKLTQEPKLYQNLAAAALLRARDFNWDQAAKELYGLLRHRPGGSPP